MDQPAGKSRVLVVDDELMLRTLMGRALESDGHIVQIAASGFEAIAAIEASPPDVLVLDLVMPGMPGEDVLGWLRDHGVRVPTLVVSASLHGLRLAREGGADVHMFKPFDLDRLCEHVQYLANLAEVERMRLPDRARAEPVCRS